MHENINQIIKQRRSHYPQEYNGKILENEVINTLLENANWAPNHTLNYPWRFKIIYQPEITTWLNKAIDIYKTETALENINPKKIEKLEIYKSKISHAIAIVLQHQEPIKNQAIEDICAVACAVQNMYLSLSQFPHAVGYWSTGLGTYSASMHQYLNLQPLQQLMGFFILGDIENKRIESNRKGIEAFLL